MIVVFYDRKNRREVTNEQLMPIKLVREVWLGCSQDPDQDCLVTEDVATLGYKSEECPNYKNWDLYCNYTDLIFLRLEE